MNATLGTAFAILLASSALAPTTASADEDLRKPLIGTWRTAGGEIAVSDRGIVRSSNGFDASVTDPTSPANFAFFLVKDGGVRVTCAYEVTFVAKDVTAWRDVANPRDGTCPPAGDYERGEE